MQTFKKYFRVWLITSRNSFQTVVTQKAGFIVFLLGKLIRFGFFFYFVIFLLRGTQNLAGYSLNQTLFFFLTFNLIDTLAQFFFREVYRFRPLIVTGNLDLILVKPINALFRVLMGGADIIDLVTIPPLIWGLIYLGVKLNPTPLSICLYVVLLVNGLVLATAFYILVLGLGIISMEVDHTIMIYRDLSSLGRLPVDIYREPVRGLLTYLIPIGIMMTVPAKTLMGLTPYWLIGLSLVIGTAAFYGAIKFWQWSLTKYASASS